MNHAVRLVNLTVVRQKTTNDNLGIYFPVKIYFEKEISDEKLQLLAFLAKWIQDREEGDNHEMQT